MSRPRILVVDDSRTMRVQLREALSMSGFDVELASDGREGLHKIRNTLPTVVILDIQMPGLDGYAVCQELRSMGSPWDLIPIVFLTSLDTHALDILGHEMGEYLRKPVCPRDLVAAVRRLAAPLETTAS